MKKQKTYNTDKEGIDKVIKIIISNIENNFDKYYKILSFVIFILNHKLAKLIQNSFFSYKIINIQLLIILSYLFYKIKHNKKELIKTIFIFY